MYPTANAPKSIPIDAKQHPEWPKFNEAMKAKNISEAKILLIWTKTLKGIKLQEEMNESGKRYERNEHFADVADAMGEELKIKPGKNLALWSGGYDVSEYARKRKNCTTLESTVLGGVFDELELYCDWKCIGPLWNAISRMFVAQGYGFVHVFIRVHAPDSVLYREEVPTLMGNLQMENLPAELRVKGLFWHALFGDGSWQNLKEVDSRGELVQDYSFPNEHDARMAMKNFLVRQSQAKRPGTFATGAMKID